MGEQVKVHQLLIQQLTKQGYVQASVYELPVVELNVRKRVMKFSHLNGSSRYLIAFVSPTLTHYLVATNDKVLPVNNHSIT